MWNCKNNRDILKTNILDTVSLLTDKNTKLEVGTLLVKKKIIVPR